ncbi:MAG TPA: potassium channel family protein [bacterium]|nr:potassium channel family protein [bacterium]
MDDKNNKKAVDEKTPSETSLARIRKYLKDFWASLRKERFPVFAAFIMGFALFTSFIMGFVLEKNTAMYFDVDKNPFVRLVSGFYYAIVSMSSTGYGDYSPKTVGGKLFASFMIIVGVTCFALISGTIASILVERKIKEGKGLMDLSKLKYHTIICGWKKNMEKTLDDIFTVNSALKPEEVVVIANISSDEIDLFKQQNPKYKDINYLRGEYFNENMLLLASVNTAKSVFILADEHDSATPSEVDSKTVMTAMTVSTIARNVHMCAEILDPKFESYLHKAHVSEIIFPTQYGRLMLAHSTASSGLVEVINDLLDLKTSNSICTRKFPDSFIGRPYSELREYINGHGCLALGLLENVGSFFERKQEALREAQKTPDISKLVGNLQKVKSMKNNYPNFNPDETYVVPRHSMVIILETKRECAAHV